MIFVYSNICRMETHVVPFLHCLVEWQLKVSKANMKSSLLHPMSVRSLRKSVFFGLLVFFDTLVGDYFDSAI